MRTLIVDHALAADRLTQLRDHRTPRSAFRAALHELSGFLIYEACRQLAVVELPVDTPIATTTGRRLGDEPLLVPVLRAGLGMLVAAQTLLPEAAVAFVGLRRDERSLAATQYLSTVPRSLDGAPAIVLDPTLATGGSMVQTLDLLAESDVGAVIVVTVIAAQPGLHTVEKAHPGVFLVTAAVDEDLDDVGLIDPGLGDAGDRQFGVA